MCVYKVIYIIWPRKENVFSQGFHFLHHVLHINIKLIRDFTESDILITCHNDWDILWRHVCCQAELLLTTDEQSKTSINNHYLQRKMPGLLFNMLSAMQESNCKCSTIFMSALPFGMTRPGIKPRTFCTTCGLSHHIQDVCAWKTAGKRRKPFLC